MWSAVTLAFFPVTVTRYAFLRALVSVSTAHGGVFFTGVQTFLAVDPVYPE